MSKNIYLLSSVFFDRELDTVFGSIVMLTNNTIEGIEKEELPMFIEKCESEYAGLSPHHIIVTELPIGEVYNEHDFKSLHIYLGDGSKYIDCDYQSTLSGGDTFVGRDGDELPLKKGDKVEYIDGDGIKKGVIFELPIQKGKFDNLDWSDDSYVILEGFDELPEVIDEDTYMKYHQHIFVGDAFKRVDE